MLLGMIQSLNLKKKTYTSTSQAWKDAIKHVSESMAEAKRRRLEGKTSSKEHFVDEGLTKASGSTRDSRLTLLSEDSEEWCFCTFEGGVVP